MRGFFLPGEPVIRREKKGQEGASGPLPGQEMFVDSLGFSAGYLDKK